MTERTPQPGPDDDTQRLQRPGAEQGAAPRGGQAGGGLGFSYEDDAAPPRRRNRPGAGVIAALLVAALVVGGLAGVLGAAGFTTVSDRSGPSTGSTTATSSPVVDSKQPAPPASSVAAVAKVVLPSVVKITVQNAQQQGSGSGIIISSDGEILTNNHVAAVAGQQGRIVVNFNDGSAKPARIVGTDPVTDLAVIKAVGASGLRPATIGNSDNLRVGQNVVAIGSPFGLQATVTSGIVSAKNRPVTVATGNGSPVQSGQSTTYPAIQTDAAINPGNSGGPLVDLSGAVVGINSSIRTASSGGLDSAQGGSIGLGFAIPISKVWPVVQQLRNGQQPTHARMGVSVSDATSRNGLVTGAGVASVNAGSAAARAGLRKGDVIVKVDGEVVTGSDSLVATIRGYRPGDKVTLTIVRGGTNRRQVPVTLGSDRGAATS